MAPADFVRYAAISNEGYYKKTSRDISIRSDHPCWIFFCSVHILLVWHPVADKIQYTWFSASYRIVTLVVAISLLSDSVDFSFRTRGV